MTNVLPFSPSAYAGSVDPIAEEWAIDLPSGYSLRRDGVWMETEEGEEVFLCSPLQVTGICHSPAGNGYGRVIEITAHTGHVRTLVVDEAIVQGSLPTLLRPLVDNGLVLSATHEAAKKLHALLKAWRPARSILRVQCTGWVNKDYESYVLPWGEVIGAHAVVADPALLLTPQAVAGDLAGWKQEVSELCQDNPLAILAVSQAFVGPLLRPLGLQGGGFHLYGASSAGKSTLVEVAASVWGDPKRASSWRTTDNALEGLAFAANDALLVLDEMGQSDGKVAGEAAYLLANGKAKARSSGKGQVGPVQTWAVAILSNGEVSLEEHIATSGRKMHAGQGVRIVDLPSDGRAHGAFDALHGCASGKELSEAFLNGSRRHHGTAGKAFVAALNPENVETWRSLMRACMKRFIDRHDLVVDAQTQRTLDRFAVTAVAGELATKAGITGWKGGDAVEAAIIAVGIWAEGRDASCQAEIDYLLDVLRGFYHTAAFTEKGKPMPLNAAGWVEGDLVCISIPAWRGLFGDAATDAASCLARHRLLVTDLGKALQHKMGRWVKGRPRSYAIRRSCLAAGKTT